MSCSQTLFIYRPNIVNYTDKNTHTGGVPANYRLPTSVVGLGCYDAQASWS